MRSLRILAVLLMMGALSAAPAVAAKKVDKSRNVRRTGGVAYKGGTELAAQGDFVYSGELNGVTERNSHPKKGGIHITDVSRRRPREVGYLRCPGNDNDVDVVRPGLLVVGYHTNVCAQADDGMMLVDVSNPRRPHIAGNLALPAGSAGSSHTITPYPGRDLVYISPGGLANGRSTEYIVDVSNASKPKIVAEYLPSATGCHDLAFHISKRKQLAFCAGYGETSIWDVSDPLAPVTIGRIHNPAIQFQHFAVPSDDGKLLAIDDEAFAAHECRTGNSPTGAVWIYDVSNPAMPVLHSRYAPPRGGDDTGVGTYPGWVPSWCLSHGLDWQPGTHKLAVTWFTGGWSVLDLSEPTSPQEVAHFQARNSSTYSTLWHRGRLYTNDSNRGLEGFDVTK